MNKIELMRVYFVAKDILAKLKAGQQLDQTMLERLDRAVEGVKVDVDAND